MRNVKAWAGAFLCLAAQRAQTDLCSEMQICAGIECASLFAVYARCKEETGGKKVMQLSVIDFNARFLQDYLQWSQGHEELSKDEEKLEEYYYSLYDEWLESPKKSGLGVNLPWSILTR